MKLYDCPIIALYMVLNHGVKIKNFTEAKLRYDVGIDDTDELYYVENLDILEPRDGDISEDGYIYCIINNGWVTTYGDVLPTNTQKIAKRDDKYFFLPKSEGL
jgi:hypothetical protein